MSTFNFHGDVNGPSNFGDHGKIVINQGPAQLAAELVRHLQSANAPLVVEAEVVRSELDSAARENRETDKGKLRKALETISAGLAVGSGGLTLVHDLKQAIGL